MTDHLDRGLVEGPVWPLDKAGRHRRPFNETTSHGLGPHRARIHAFVPDAVDMRDQQFEFMTGRDMGLGTEWGNVKDLVSSSSSSSSSGRGGLKDSGIAITITPPVLHQSGDMVEVCVAQVPGADASTDFIAAYAPADVDLHATAPVKLKYLHEETSASLPASLYSSTGQGCVSFRLLNLRDAYSFAVMRGNVTSPLLLATSAAVGFKEPNEVTQVHLALTGNDGEMSVTWVTRDTRAPVVQWWAAMPDEGGGWEGGRASSSRRQVKAGDRKCRAVEWRRQSLKGAKKTEPGDLAAASSSPLDRIEHQAVASTTTYTRLDMCSPPAATIGFHDPGAIHSALMRGLEGGRDYTYRVGDAELNVWSDCITFTAPPFFPSKEVEGGAGGGGKDVTYTFAVFGDMGTAEEDGSTNMGGEEVASLNTTRLLLRALSSSISRPPLSLVLHIGDLSYARGYDYQWDEFLAQNEDIMKVVPWMVSSGNHERDASAVSLYRPSPSLYIGEDSGGECGVPTQIRFPMPGPWQEAEKDEPWYSFSSGPVRWVVLCIEKDFMPGSPQHDFLLDALSSQMNRTLTPWVVVAAHRPMYIDSDWDDPEKEASDQEVAKKMQEGLEDVLMQYKVDLGIYGHHHSYQRTCQVYRNKCLAPSGGTEYKAPVHAVVGMAGQGLSQNALAVRPAIFEHVDTSHFGLTLMTVNRTHLTLTLYSDEEGGEVLDTFTLLGKAGGEGGRASVVRTEG
ncbi:hypothetical protein VYU27_006628 [Nannochloropsis oceanica]